MIQPNSKLPDVGVTIFAVMTQLANEQGAINLSLKKAAEKLCKI
jgi:hypothetical protein